MAVWCIQISPRHKASLVEHSAAASAAHCASPHRGPCKPDTLRVSVEAHLAAAARKAAQTAGTSVAPLFAQTGRSWLRMSMTWGEMRPSTLLRSISAHRSDPESIHSRYGRAMPLGAAHTRTLKPSASRAVSTRRSTGRKSASPATSTSVVARGCAEKAPATSKQQHATSTSVAPCAPETRFEGESTSSYPAARNALCSRALPKPLRCSASRASASQANRLTILHGLAWHASRSAASKSATSHVVCNENADALNCNIGDVDNASSSGTAPAAGGGDAPFASCTESASNASRPTSSSLASEGTLASLPTWCVALATKSTSAPLATGVIGASALSFCA
eukprot:4251560-Pleurochrysis_carterae.AAC.6